MEKDFQAYSEGSVDLARRARDLKYEPCIGQRTITTTAAFKLLSPYGNTPCASIMKERLKAMCQIFQEPMITLQRQQEASSSPKAATTDSASHMDTPAATRSSGEGLSTRKRKASRRMTMADEDRATPRPTRKRRWRGDDTTFNAITDDYEDDTDVAPSHRTFHPFLALPTTPHAPTTDVDPNSMAELRRLVQRVLAMWAVVCAEIDEGAMDLDADDDASPTVHQRRSAATAVIRGGGSTLHGLFVACLEEVLKGCLSLSTEWTYFFQVGTCLALCQCFIYMCG